MLFISQAHLNAPKHIADQADGIELRLDLLESIDVQRIAHFIQNAPCPVMLTLRKISQGGNFRGTEEERERLIDQLLMFTPPFFDLEGDMRPAFLEASIKKHSNTRFVLSHHDFEKTPTDLELEAIYRSLSKYSPFNCKIAAMATSVNDALRMLLFVRKHSQCSAISMGEKGSFARILGKIAGNLIDYAVPEAENKTAPGQMTTEDLLHIYRYRSFNRDTEIYGLIGNPILKSPGHIYHNEVFRKARINAVYVKMQVEPQELEAFIFYAKKIGIKGLSVTTPLKEIILRFIDELDPQTRAIGAVNTLRLEAGRIYGINTDGAGALDAIEKQRVVHGKNLVLIGAGGAARGIAFEARHRGAHVMILNRTRSRAEELAAAVEGKAGSLSEVPMNADVLVNCTPDPLPIDPVNMRSTMLVMDIGYSPPNAQTPFLQEASKRGCSIVYGEEMFINQAKRQTNFWLASLT